MEMIAETFFTSMASDRRTKKQNRQLVTAMKNIIQHKKISMFPAIMQPRLHI